METILHSDSPHRVCTISTSCIRPFTGAGFACNGARQRHRPCGPSLVATTSRSELCTQLEARTHEPSTMQGGMHARCSFRSGSWRRRVPLTPACHLPLARTDPPGGVPPCVTICLSAQCCPSRWATCRPYPREASTGGASSRPTRFRAATADPTEVTSSPFAGTRTAARPSAARSTSARSLTR